MSFAVDQHKSAQAVTERHAGTLVGFLEEYVGHDCGSRRTRDGRAGGRPSALNDLSKDPPQGSSDLLRTMTLPAGPGGPDWVQAGGQFS
jgi:hypothetical protein